MKKVISLFLVLLTVMSISATAVFAETSAVTGKCGENITYTYDEKTKPFQLRVRVKCTII